MNETKLDIERRARLQQWIKDNPDVWADLAEEFKSCHHNEMVQLKSRTCSNKEWSSGYVNAMEFVLDFERWIKKVWTEPKDSQSHQQK